jgi:hypothetical protein
MPIDIRIVKSNILAQIVAGTDVMLLKVVVRGESPNPIEKIGRSRTRRDGRQNSGGADRVQRKPARPSYVRE